MGRSPALDASVQQNNRPLLQQSSAGQPLVLHCEVSDVDQELLLQELVAERAAIVQRLSLPDAGAPLHIHLFADAETYRQHVANRYPHFPARRAIFVVDDGKFRVFAHWGAHVAEDLRHEATHGLLHSTTPDLPLWLDEGLAEYFEVGREGGGLNRSHIELLRSQQAVAGWQPDLDELEQLTDAAAMTRLQYAEAWLWVHFLLGSPDTTELLSEYLAAIRDGGAREPLSLQFTKMAPEASAAALQHLERFSSR